MAALESVLQRADKRYLMANVPRGALDDVKRILPGISGPTIVDVLDGGDLRRGARRRGPARDLPRHCRPEEDRRDRHPGHEDRKAHGMSTHAKALRFAVGRHSIDGLDARERARLLERGRARDASVSRAA